MHNYLSHNLKEYAVDCCAPYSPPNLHLPSQSQAPTDLNITVKSYTPNLCLTTEGMDGDSISDVAKAQVRYEKYILNFRLT